MEKSRSHSHHGFLKIQNNIKVVNGPIAPYHPNFLGIFVSYKIIANPIRKGHKIYPPKAGPVKISCMKPSKFLYTEKILFKIIDYDDNLHNFNPINSLKKYRIRCRAEILVDLFTDEEIESLGINKALKVIEI